MTHVNNKVQAGLKQVIKKGGQERRREEKIKNVIVESTSQASVELQ